MKQSRTTIKELTARYRAVLLKCALINAMIFMGIGAANADPLIVSQNEEITASPGTYDKIEVNGGKLFLSNGYFMTAETEEARADTSSVTNGTMFLSSNVELNMNSETLVINGSDFTISTGSRIRSRDVEVSNGSTLNINSIISKDFLTGVAFEADSFTIRDSTVSMSGGGYGLAGNIDITNSTVKANATHIAYATNFDDDIISNPELKIGGNSVFNIAGDVKVNAVSVTGDGDKITFSKGKIILSDSTINLSGRLHADITATGGNVVFNNSAARLNGELSGSGVNLTFNDNYLFSNINNKADLNAVTIAVGKTLDIGSGTLTATNFTGGTISAVLTDAAKNTAIITGSASDVTLALDMSNASRDEVTQYHITNGTGFTFGDYAANRYAVSGTDFDIADAAGLGVLSDDWNGGDLYILRLATAGEAAVEDLQKAGVNVSLAEQKAIKALDLAPEVLSKLDAAKQEAIARVNDLLDKAAGKVQETKQILREIAPDASQSGTKTAANTAKSVINVIGARLGGGSSGNMRGRSGGDLFAGRSAVWAQGMYNKAELDTANGFKSDSTGFAAGIETNITDSVKAGIGYAFTKTNIDTDRSSTDVDTHTGFVYGEYKPNKLYVNAIASFGYSKYDDTTNLLGLTSDYKADTIGAQIAAGYELGILTPEAALRYTHVKQDDHTDALGATVRSKSFDTWTVAGGVKLAKKFTPKDNRHISITPELKLAATYDFERDDETNTVVLADGSSYIAESDMMKRFGIEAGANIGMTIGNNSEITLSYEGKFKKDYQDHTGLINFKYLF